MYDLYQCNEDDSSRFILGKNGTRNLFIVGLNPSTATKERPDTTVAKVEQVAINNGFNGFVMANLYPLRSTDPRGLPEQEDKTLFTMNIEAILTVARKQVQPVFWAAWGGDIRLRRYLSASLKQLVVEVSSIEGRWVHFGALRKDGHPRHPSRLSYAWAFYEFNCRTYARNLP